MVIVGLGLWGVAGTGASGLNAYTDVGYGFALAYPQDCMIKKSPGGSYFAIESQQGERLLAGDVYRLADFPQDMFRCSRDPFRDFAVDRAITRCSADGPDGTAYCKGVYRISQTRTSSDLRLIEIYLIHVQERHTEPWEHTESVVGPVYAVDISRPGSVVVLLIGPAPHELLSGEQVGIVRDVAANVTLVPLRKVEPLPPAPSERIQGEPAGALPSRGPYPDRTTPGDSGSGS